MKNEVSDNRIFVNYAGHETQTESESAEVGSVKDKPTIGKTIITVILMWAFFKLASFLF